MMTTCVPDATAEANAWMHAFMAAHAGRALWPGEQAEDEELLAIWANSVHLHSTPN
ncbi:hypothetical protein [Streptomyces sp. x-19]|uniref:hypothetical protein n=1 Tax=Streptomyces sp. x-19 TaxID=2789280 RepID=UPI0039813FB3